MSFYKIQHIESGLYFKSPTHDNPSNKSKTGTVFTTKPSLGFLKDRQEWRLVELSIKDNV